MQNYSFLLFVLNRYSRVYSTRLSTRSSMRSMSIAPKARGLSHIKQLAPRFWTSVFNIKSFKNDASTGFGALSGLVVIRGESGPLQVSTGTAEKRKATEFHDRLKAERWEQGKLGAKPRRTWEEAVLKFLDESSHKRTHALERGGHGGDKQKNW